MYFKISKVKPGYRVTKKNKLFSFKINETVDYESDVANAHRDLPYYPTPAFN